MKKVNEQRSKKGFTLLEMLVVVLIIGILAGIALPQYQMAVTKAKVASILPIMRRWKDAMYEYKLQHGYYDDPDNDIYPDGSDLGVNWPSDWKTGNNKPCGDRIECWNDYWYCFANEEDTGYVYCEHDTSDGGDFFIWMFQPDEDNHQGVSGMMICAANGTEGNKVCKALGGKLLDGSMLWAEHAYKLN